MLRQKSPGSSIGVDGLNKSSALASKSPHRAPSKPSSPRGASLDTLRLPPTPTHYTTGNAHNLFKENKRLRKLLKQVYNRYNSLLYCIDYVNNTATSETSSTTTTNNHDESGSGGGGSSTINQMINLNNHQNDLPGFQLTNEMHYRIEKFITNQPPSSSSSMDSSNSSQSSSSSSYTSSSTTSTSSSLSSSSSNTISSEGEGDEDGEDNLERLLYHEPTPQPAAAQDNNHNGSTDIKGLVQELVDLVAEGN